MAHAVQESVGREERRGVADRTDEYAARKCRLDDRNDPPGLLRLPLHASHEDQGRIIFGHGRSRVVDRDDQPAD